VIDQAPEQRVWYLRREGKLAGPFNSARIRRLLLEGQVALNDEVSVDRKTWQPIARVAELVPPGLRGGADATTVGNEAANPIPWVALTVFVLLVAGAIGFAFWWGGSPPQSVPDCNAEAGAGVDWRNCRLPGLQAQGADLRADPRWPGPICRGRRWTTPI